MRYSLENVLTVEICEDKTKTPADMIKIKHFMELKAKTNKKNPKSEKFKIITQTQDRPACTKSGFIDKCRQVGKTTQLNITNTSANNQEIKVKHESKTH